MRDLQSLAARTLHGLSVRRTSTRRRLLLRDLSTRITRRASQVSLALSTHHFLELNVIRRRLARRPRQTSTASRPDNSNPRVSRSHSPTQLLKAPTSTKRRNTMNSRDAAFDESLKEIIEATAAEAAAAESANVVEDAPTQTEAIDKTRKRKRSDDDS